MPAKAKLYSSLSGLNAARARIQEALDLPDDFVWGDNEKVLNGSDKGKYILPLYAVGKWKSNQLFSGVVDYVGSWHTSESSMADPSEE